MKIRSALETDLDGCYVVENACYGDEGASKERIFKRIKLFPQGFLVAIDRSINGIINGTATDRDDISDEELKDMVDFRKDGKNIVIFSVAVLPEFQGKGIAKALLGEFIKRCRNMNKDKILLICQHNLIGMYEKFGFNLIGKSASEHGGLEWYEMHLNLR